MKSFLSWLERSFLFSQHYRSPSPQMELYSGASGTNGYDGYFNGKWFQGRWLPHMQLGRGTRISIEWQELFPIVVASAIWCPHFSGKRIQFWCDESVVAIINSGHLKALRIMDLLRFLVLLSMKHNLRQGSPCSLDFQWDFWLSRF